MFISPQTERFSRTFFEPENSILHFNSTKQHKNPLLFKLTDTPTRPVIPNSIRTIDWVPVIDRSRIQRGTPRSMPAQFYPSRVLSDSPSAAKLAVSIQFCAGREIEKESLSKHLSRCAFGENRGGGWVVAISRTTETKHVLLFFSFPLHFTDQPTIATRRPSTPGTGVNVTKKWSPPSPLVPRTRCGARRGCKSSIKTDTDTCTWCMGRN